MTTVWVSEGKHREEKTSFLSNIKGSQLELMMIKYLNPPGVSAPVGLTNELSVNV